MSQYTITAVGESVRDWNSTRDGAMKSYRVTLRNDRGAEMPNVEVSFKATDPKPEPGRVLNDITVDSTGAYGPKVVFPRKAGGGGGGFRGKPPEERRSIAMQHAQKCAVSVLAANANPTLPPFKVADVTEMAWELFRQVLAAETKDRP